MGWVLKHFASAFLLPPLNLILLGMIGLFLLKSRPKAGWRLIALSFFLLYVLSTPFFADWAMKKYEGPYSPPMENARAIVVLGGGTYFHAPEYGGINTVSAEELERLRYAAALYRKTGKPVLVTGGHPLGNSDSEASAMKEVLEDEFHVPVSWTEGSSDNTEENAKNSFAILKKQNIRKIYLVTHAWHMRRAELLFRRAGFDVVPAATRFKTSFRTSVISFLPSADALQDSELVAHELIGIAWFELKSIL